MAINNNQNPNNRNQNSRENEARFYVGDIPITQNTINNLSTPNNVGALRNNTVRRFNRDNPTQEFSDVNYAIMQSAMKEIYGEIPNITSFSSQKKGEFMGKFISKVTEIVKKGRAGKNTIEYIKAIDPNYASKIDLLNGINKSEKILRLRDLHEEKKYATKKPKFTTKQENDAKKAEIELLAILDSEDSKPKAKPTKQPGNIIKNKK